MKKGLLFVFFMLFLFFFFIVYLPSAGAWASNTHKFISETILIENFQNCLNYIRNGSTYPDTTIKDFVNHHCSDDAKDCKARIKAEEWHAKNFSTECEHAFNLAVSSHYLADSFCPAHWYSLEDCHQKLENCVDENVREGRKCWQCILECKDKQGIDRFFVVNNSYLKETANNIASSLNLSAPFQITSEECKGSFADFLTRIIEFILKLFQQK